MAESLQAGAGAAQDPRHTPALLLPRTRADVVQDRPAGGTPAEVAAANPALASAVPTTVGGGAGGADTRGGLPPAATGEAGAAALGGPPAGLEDGSGMEMPELALQSGWGEGSG